MKIEETQHSQRALAVEPMVKQAINKGLLSETTPSVDLFNQDSFRARLRNLLEAFPGEKFNHAVAVKANPIHGCLKIAHEMGLGAECASICEVFQAISVGFKPDKVVFDSPCKTLSEISTAIELGCYINVDNEAEIRKINEILTQKGKTGDEVEFERKFGLRINPIVGPGTIAIVNTATKDSKFGLPLTEDTEDRIIKIFHDNPWLQGVHVHVGSQGCELQMLVEGVKKTLSIAEKINESVGYQQIRVLDIGGGLPTDYTSEKEAYDFKQYSNAIKSQVPAVLNGKYEIITEFGRSVFTKSGVSVSRVEAIKDWAGQHIAVVNVGANQFIREAYLPDQWRHRISVLDSKGKEKRGQFVKQDIAGPMCFGGDFVCKGVHLPLIEEGDFIVVHDTGAYTMSMYSNYTSRLSSPVYGYKKITDGGYKYFLFKEGGTVSDMLAFWGVKHPMVS